MEKHIDNNMKTGGYVGVWSCLEIVVSRAGDIIPIYPLYNISSLSLQPPVSCRNYDYGVPHHESCGFGWHTSRANHRAP